MMPLAGTFPSTHASSLLHHASSTPCLLAVLFAPASLRAVHELLEPCVAIIITDFSAAMVYSMGVRLNSLWMQTQQQSRAWRSRADFFFGAVFHVKRQIENQMTMGLIGEACVLDPGHDGSRPLTLSPNGSVPE
jgi:hypothetical protein